MTRIKRGVAAHKRRKNLIKRAKGFMNRRSTNFAQAREALIKAGAYAYRDRRNRKRDFRSLWLVRANAGLRENNTTWSKFAGAIKKHNVIINRKMLSELAVRHPQIFDNLAKSIGQ